MLFVLFSHLCLAHFDEPDDPARIKIDHEADAFAILGQMLNRQPQSPRTRGTERQPIGAARKELFRQGFTKGFVIQSEVLDVDPGFWNSRAATGFESVDGLAGKALRHPATHRATTQPFVLKWSQAREIIISLNFFTRVPAKSFGVVQPERTTRGRIEVPLNNLTDPGVEGFA